MSRPGRSGWGVIIAYALVVAATQMLWLTFAPIDTDAARDWHVSQNAVGWLANVFPLFYVVLALPAGIALDRWFRSALITGATLTACGGLLRLVAPDFGWAMAGQVVEGIAQPLVLNALTKTATGYLPERARPTGIAVGSAGQFIGAIIALAMGPALEHKHSLGPLLPVQAGLAVVAALALTVVLLRRAPAGEIPSARIGIDELRAVWRVPLIRTLTALAFVGIGVFVALSTYLQPILHRDHISSNDAGLMLAGMLVAGTLGCGLLPPQIARRGAGRAYMLLTCCWITGCCVLLAILHADRVADFIIVAAIGLVLLAALPVLLELTERRMGALGGVATGMLLLAGNGGGLIIAVLVGALDHIPLAAFLALAVAGACGIVPARRLAIANGEIATDPTRQHVQAIHD